MKPHNIDRDWQPSHAPIRLKWFTGTKKKRFRFPYSWKWMQRLPQPRWLRRLYYRFSYWAWGHPSNHHWKMSTFDTHPKLAAGERDLFSGGYCDGQNENKC